MSSATIITERLNSFYKEIESEIKELRKSQKYLVNKQKLNDLTIEKCKKFQTRNHDSNKTVDIPCSERKIEKDAGTVVERKKAKRKSIGCMKSLSPIWDENKLNVYMKYKLNDILNTSDDESKEIIEPKTISEQNDDNSFQGAKFSNDYMNNKATTTKRNVGTNIKFLIYGTDGNNLNEKCYFDAKRVNRRTQTVHPNDLKIGVHKKNEKQFSHRVERVVNNDKSVSVKFKHHFKTPETREGKQKQQQQLAFSNTTFTSTNGQKKSTKNDDIIRVVGSNLVTNDTKQMSVVLLPVLSINGKCSVQKIYQFEISPTITDLLHNNDCNNAANVKFIEIKYGTECTESKKENDAEENITNDATAPDLTENSNMLFNINDIKNALRYYNVNIDNGKVHVVLENSENMKIKKRRRQCKRQSRKKKRKDFMGTGYKSISSVKQDKLRVNKSYENIQSKVDSSSSLTDDDDDRKLYDVLKFYGEMNKMKEKGNKVDNIFSHDDDDRYPYPTNTSSNETQNNHNNMTNEVKKGNDLEYNNVTKSFQSIYKLIEDTFQSTLTETKSYGNEMEHGNSMGEMKHVIKMSEENIKKAELLLQKYRIAKNEMYPLSSDKNKESYLNSMREENPKTFDANNKLNLYSDKSDKFDEKSINNTCQLEGISAQQNIIDIKEKSTVKCQDYAMFRKELQHKMQQTVNTVDSNTQTINHKALQTEENFDWKTRFYFKPIFDNYSKINFNAKEVSSQKQIKVSKIESTKDNPVPYNELYSNNNEIMEIANKFLRSVEKEKKGTNQNNEEESYSEMNFQEFREISSSVSTPSSDSIQEAFHNEELHILDKKSKVFKNHLDYMYSDGEISSLGEVKLLSSLSDENSTDES